MNRFDCLTSGTRSRSTGRVAHALRAGVKPRGDVAGARIRRVNSARRAFLLLSAASTLGVLSLLSTSAFAQRVQFPTSAQPVQTTIPYTPPPTFGGTVSPPPPTTYPTTPFGTSPAPPPAAYSPAAVGPPPIFDPYAAGNTVAPPPPAVPYNYTPPPPASSFPQQPAPMFPQGAPIQYQPPPYDMATSSEGYWQKTQRFLQEMSVEYTFLYGDHTDPNDFSVNRLELSSTFAFPMFYNIETPLLVTPGFAFNFFGGPLSGAPMGMPPTAGGPDLPAQVYDAYLDFAWYPRCYEWIGGEFGFRPGVYTDFDNVNSDSLRFQGRALGSVAVTPNLDVLFGAVYLDRVDVKLLPAGGVYYRPTPEWDMYLVFPNPKVRKYFTSIGNSKWYWFAAGEYGGGSWTVERQTTDDRIDYNDIRFSGGVEWETQTFIRGHLELGYVWDREIIFVSGDPPSFKPDDTIMIRAGIDF